HRPAVALKEDGRERVPAAALGSTTSCAHRHSDRLLEALHVLWRLDATPARPRAAPRQADVPGDLIQPRRLELGDDAALDRAECLEERRLRRVLGVLAIPQLQEAVGEDLPPVPLVEITRDVGGRLAR